MLVYAAHTAEFVELGRGGVELLRALARAGSVGTLLERYANDGRTSPEALERARSFFARLLTLGLLESDTARERTRSERAALLAAKG